MTLLVTGGSGFISTNFVLGWCIHSDEPIVTLDKLTYAGNLENLVSLQGNPGHIFVQGDMGDRALVDKLQVQHRPRAVLCCTSPPKVMWTDPFMGPRTLFRPISWAPSELGWKPAETFEMGIGKTVQGYLDNPAWIANVKTMPTGNGCLSNMRE